MTAPSTTNSISDKIYACLDLDDPNSSFLFARAGSWETGPLVESLRRFSKERIKQLRLSGRKAAIITYTKAACDEIERRLEYDPVFYVSTIHRFAWDLIKPYQADIRDWLKGRVQSEIEALIAIQRKEQTVSQATSARLKQIAGKLMRLESLEYIRQFSYNPNGNNKSPHSLNHVEVIDMTAEFLQKRELLQKNLVRTFPILLIDERVSAVLKA